MKACLAVVCLTLALAAPAIAQSERPSATDGLAVIAQAQRSSAERVGGSRNRVLIEARHADGRLFFRSATHNLRTNAGTDWQAKAMADTATAPATCNYIALTSDSAPAAATDNALAAELTTAGLARAQGSFTHASGTNTYAVSKTFTASGSVSGVQKAALFNAASGGTMCFEANFTPAANLAAGDTLTITWAVTLN